MTSTVPAAIAALVSLAEAAVSVDVHDGPPVGGNTEDYVCIGHDPSGGPESATTDAEWAGFGGRQSETYGITCAAVSASGDLSMSARRVAAYALVDAISTAIASNVNLGGVVDLCSITSHSLLQEQNESGAMAGVRFTVTVQKF